MLWIRKFINQTPSFNNFETHISTIEKTVETNPALCIETCKSLVESICKTILTNQNIEHDNYGQFQALVKQTINCLIDTNECYKDDLCELVRRIASVSQKLAEIRNISGFASHGQDINHVSMSTTMSLLAYKITDVLGGFIIHYYINHASKRDSRIHYEDCQEFNELFDEENPLELGGVILSASEALYKQDYQAYKEIYFSYLDNLEKESKKDKGLFKKLFKIENDSNQKISKYLTLDKRRDLEKIDKCSKCECRNCVSICNMNHCFNCREKEYIVKCDKDTTLLTKTTDTVELYQGDEKFVFNVAGYLVEKDDNGNFSRYVYLIDSKDYDNQHILKYSKFKGEESYDSVITDGTQDELIRINDKFIEMGLRV